MTFTLARHQVYGSSLMDAVGSIGLFFGCGCGKTATVLDWVYRHVQDGSVSQVLVVCPASLRANWALSIDRMSEFEGYTQEGIAKVREAVEIRSYQGIYKRIRKVVQHRNGQESERTIYGLRDEVNHPWDAIIADESHALGSHSSVQTRMMLNLAKLSETRVTLSGTPVTGGGGRADWSKMYGQVEFLDPGFFGTWTKFKARCVRSIDPWGNPSTYNEAECERIINAHGIFVRLEEIRDMPDKIFTMLPVPMDPRAEGAYADIRNGNVAPWGVDIKVAGGQYAKLFQICSGFLYRDDGTVQDFKTPKEEVVRQLVEGADGKVVIFARFTRSIERLCAIFPQAVRYDGKSKGPTWQEFQYGSAPILIVQYDSGNAGIDLFASHLMIFYEPTLSALQLDQAQDRIYRTGQTNQCRYWFLYSQGTYEEKAVESVRSGVDVTRSLMDKWAGIR